MSGATIVNPQQYNVCSHKTLNWMATLWIVLMMKWLKFGLEHCDDKNGNAYDHNSDLSVRPTIVTAEQRKAITRLMENTISW